MDTFFQFAEIVLARWYAGVTGVLFAVDQLLQWVWPAAKARLDTALQPQHRRRLEVAAMVIAFGVASFEAYYEEHKARAKVTVALASTQTALAAAKADLAEIREASKQPPPTPGQTATSASERLLLVPPAATDRRRFVEPLKAFYAEGVLKKMALQASNAGEDEKKQTDRMFDWINKTSKWICPNMGIYALSKFTDQNLNPATMGSTPSGRAGTMMMTSFLDNLEEIIKNNTWDPVGKPNLPAQGCDKYIG